MSNSPSHDFIAGIPAFQVFAGVADSSNYVRLPDDWVLALTDIVGSTEAIANGRYKQVNMAGVSAISALVNALGSRELPFVFGGDGSLIALPGEQAEAAREALAAVRTWVSEELDLTMRAALIPLAAIRAAGHDVLVARFQASEFTAYAMFAGGGASWAEVELKAGRFDVPAAPAGARPDLAGLSCRWSPVTARRGTVASIIALPGSAADRGAFQQLVTDIVAIAGEQGRGGRPIPAEGPDLGFSLSGVAAEARAMAPRGRRFRAVLMVLAQVVLTWLLAVTHKSLGRFDANRYRRDVGDNSDFRKFDDGLKMTVDLDPAHMRRIEARLGEGERAGVCRYGVYKQDQALITCFVTSPLERDHMHFIDGAAGGYALASAALKAKLPMAPA